MFPVIFFDVDTQRDFIEDKGAYPVKDAVVIRSRLRELAIAARDLAIPVLASCDSHRPDDPEFSNVPPHCIAGTKGQEKIPETWIPGAFFVPPSGRRRPWVNMKDWKLRGGQIVVEKTTISPFDNPATESLLRTMEPRRIVIYGVTTEGSVRAAADKCLILGLGDVFVVGDAIRGRDPDAEHRARVELAERGAMFVTAHDLCVMAAKWMAEKR